LVSVATGTEARLLERDPELALIEERLENASHGRGGLLLVRGSAGIGKSSLLGSAEQRARAGGLTVLRARGHDAEREFAFGGCLQLFERILAEPSRSERLLVGAAELARPLLGAEGLDPPAGDPPEGPDRIFGVLDGLFWLTANLADEGPLLIAVDDAHWLDEPSLRFLRYLAVRIDELPVALLVAWRLGEPSSARRQLEELQGQRAAPCLELRPLSEPGVAAMVRQGLAEAEPEFCQACAELTGGNPFYVGELVGAIKRAGIAGRAEDSARLAGVRPRAVGTSVLARIGRHGDDALGLARAVAIAGDGVSLARASALASLDPAVARDAAAALAEAAVLEAGDPLGFVHPLVREAVYDDIPPALRARRHGEAARLLHGERADPEQVASQLLRASALGEPWAIDVLRVAARRALDRGVPAAATRYLRRALEERPAPVLRAELLAECGTAARVTGEPDALGLLEQAVELSADPVARGRLLAAAGQALLDQGLLPAAAETFSRGLAELEEGEVSAPELRAKLWAGRELATRFGSPNLDPVDDLQRALGERGPTFAGERSLLAFVAFQRASTLHSTCSEVREIALRALGDGSAFVDGDATRAAVFLVFALGLCEEHELVIRISEETLRLARRRGSVLAHANASHALATMRQRSGQLSEAVADATSACEAGRFGWQLYQPSARAMLAEALLDRGELEEAVTALDVPDADERWGGRAPYFFFLASRARLALTRGQAQEALDGFHAAGRMGGAWGARNPAIYPWRSGAALAALRLGEREEARRLAASELDDARAWEGPRPIGIALRTSGLVEGGDDGIDLLRAAAAELERSPSPVERARALIELGAALRRSGRRRDAREPLRQALDIARRCEAHALTSRADEELRASGARPRRTELSGAEALTPMERRTARLAAEGLSNREVAQSLFLTVRTVEMHLSHAYRKLGITSRRQLPRALRR
jgi:DNA-binding CsgD family transcriptional regulator